VRTLEEQLRSLDAMDWEDTEAVQEKTAGVLARLANDRALLRALLEGALEDPDLLSMCEYDPVLNKIVLYSDPDRGLRLRIHVFKEGGPDRPHNHRWPFASRVLYGGYRHVLFEPESLANDDWPKALRPLLVQDLRPGASYSLHHSMVHSLDAQPGSVSMILRGSAAKERMIVMDRHTDELWYHYGAADDKTEESRKHIVMTADHLRGLIEHLASLGVV
jgi:hypothetical protein